MTHVGSISHYEYNNYEIQVAVALTRSKFVAFHSDDTDEGRNVLQTSGNLPPKEVSSQINTNLPHTDTYLIVSGKWSTIMFRRS